MPSVNDVFTFRQFVILQSKCAMKVGTDGVLLGAWTETEGATQILDVGTGTGVIALMLAQRCDAFIDSIEIDKSAFEQALFNFRKSKWRKRLRCFNTALQDFVNEKTIFYDLIVSNPPFFINAHKSSSESRNVARHVDETLSFEELIDDVERLLLPAGRFCLILPVMEGKLFIEMCEKKKLFCNKITRVKTRADKQEKRLLLEFGFVRKLILSDELVIQNEDGSYSNQFIELTKDYYTHFPERFNVGVYSADRNANVKNVIAEDI